MKKKHEPANWKKRFIILITINIVLIVLFAMFVYSPIPKTELEESSQEYKSENSSEFIVRTTKQNVNNLVNAYIDKLLANSKHDYTINLEEDVQLLGELPIFSTSVPVLIHFDPVVQDNGDLVLEQKSISVGNLKLPNKKIMQYLKKYLPVPEWVIIQPDKESVYVKVSEMNIKSNFEVGVQRFDLDDNVIAFRIKVPYETLGIDVMDELQEKETEDNNQDSESD